MKTFLNEGVSRRDGGLFVEIQAGGSQLVPHLENLAGENAVGVEHLGKDEYIQVAKARFELSSLTIDWLGVGVAGRQYQRHVVWGQPMGERLPALRFNRALDHRSEFFDDNEPFKYRVLFRQTTEGLKWVGIERLVAGEVYEDGAEWQECDLDTSYLILVALHDLLPRLNQRGE